MYATNDIAEPVKLLHDITIDTNPTCFLIALKVFLEPPSNAFRTGRTLRRFLRQHLRWIAILFVEPNSGSKGFEIP